MRFLAGQVRLPFAPVLARVAYKLGSPIASVRPRLAKPSFERLLLPLTRGRSFESPVREILIPPIESYPAGSYRRTERHGIALNLDLSDWADFTTYWDWRNEIYDAIYDHTPADGAVLDIGANIGFTALRSAQRGARVVAFEPNPETLLRLKRNVALNPTLDVEVVAAAVGSREGTAYLEPAPPHQSGSTMVYVGEAQGRTPVPVTTIDITCDERNLVPALVKIDAEGSEDDILRGGENTIRNARPVLIVECVDSVLREHGSSSDELKQHLRDLGYRLKALQGRDPDGDNLDLVAMPS